MAMTDRYNAMRARAGQNAMVEKQQAGDAMARRFARLGNLNSGAMIGASQQAEADIDKRKQEALENIEFNQAAEQERLDEAERGRRFLTSERLGSQDFASSEAGKQRGWQSGEAEKQRGWGTSERIAGQDFASKEAKIGREWQTAERMAAQKWQGDENYSNRELQRAAMAQQQDQWYRTSDPGNINSAWSRQFEEDKRVTDFNMEMAKQANKSPFDMGGLFGGEWKAPFSNKTAGGMFGNGVDRMLRGPNSGIPSAFKTQGKSGFGQAYRYGAA